MMNSILITGGDDMFALIFVALMGLLALLAPRYGADTRPGFTNPRHR